MFYDELLPYYLKVANTREEINLLATVQVLQLYYEMFISWGLLYCVRVAVMMMTIIRLSGDYSAFSFLFQPTFLDAWN